MKFPTVRSRVPVPRKAAWVDTGSTLKCAFLVGNGRMILASDTDVQLPHHLILDGQPIALIDRAEVAASDIAAGSPYGYIATTD
jgi:hypothetical protein